MASFYARREASERAKPVLYGIDASSYILSCARCTHVNTPGFSGRLLTTIYKQETFTLRIGDQLIQKMNFNISGVSLIQKSTMLAGMQMTKGEYKRRHSN